MFILTSSVLRKDINKCIGEMIKYGIRYSVKTYQV